MLPGILEATDSLWKALEAWEGLTEADQLQQIILAKKL